MLEKHIYFTTQRDSYRDGVELTASYGAHYHRTYASEGFDSPPPTARVPPDRFVKELFIDHTRRTPTPCTSH